MSLDRGSSEDVKLALPALRSGLCQITREWGRALLGDEKVLHVASRRPPRTAACGRVR